MGDMVIIPTPRNAEGYAELSRTRQGRLFKKHILNLGELKYEGQTFNLDDAWFNKLKDNFNSGVCDIVQVPLADAQNRHTEAPERNLGEVVDIVREGNKVYTMLDIRDSDAADKLGKTMLGASAFLHMNYKDTATQKRVGPALLHHCVTNRPYCTGLDDYQEVIAASADGTGDVLVLAEEESAVPTKEELLEQLKAEHGIDVEAALAAASAKQDTAALTAAIMDALKDKGVQLTGGETGDVSPTDVVGAIVELAGKNDALTLTVSKLERKNAENEVDGFISVGRLLPKARNRAVEMVLSGEGLEDFLSPVNEPYVKLNNETKGVDPADGETKHVEDLDAEIARLSQENPAIFTKNNGK